MDSPVSCWVNVEVAGVVVGDGPIRHVVSWSSTALLSKAGSFTLTVAAHDPRADLLRSKRVVRCWAIVGGAPTEIGAGIIDEIRWTADGLHLVISGSDLLAELRYRSVHDLQIYDEDLAPPTKVWLSLGDPPVFTDLADTYNDDYVGEETFTLTSTDGFIYIGYSAPFTVLYTFQGAGGNDNPSTLQYRYSAVGKQWEDEAATVPLLADDTNIVADIPFPAAHASNNPPIDGTNTLLFRAPVDWEFREVNGVGAFWLRIDPASLLDAIPVVEFAIGLRSIAVNDVSVVMDGYAGGDWNVVGDEWSSDSLLVPTVPAVAGEVYRDTAAGSYAVFAGELVLSALVKIAKRSGESFRLGAGRKLHWLRTDGTAASFAASGVRAVRATGNERQTANPLTCQIVSLEQLRDTNDLITRIYPYGAGNGTTRVSLKNATLTMPTDFEMDTGENYIRRISTEDPAVYGRIERVMSFKDIRATDNLTFDSPEACDQLAQAALTFLQRHSSEQQFYRLVVVGLPGLLQVGTRIRVIYREAAGGRAIKNVNDTFIILSATTEFSEGEVSTTVLEVGTTDALPATDAEVLADVIEQGATYESHSQYVDALVVI